MTGKHEEMVHAAPVVHGAWLSKVSLDSNCAVVADVDEALHTHVVDEELDRVRDALL